MNAVLYYSNTGESKRVAEYLAKQTGYDLIDIITNTQYDYDTAVVVFPVYCQNIPKRVCMFLSKLQTKYLAAVATYGKMSYGNVLYEIQKEYSFSIIAAAYVPTKHAYLNETRFEGFDKLATLLEKINKPNVIKIPKSRKNPFANFAPKLRSRIGCKIVKDKSKCNSCGTCGTICPEQAIENGKTDNKCIRCMRCVESCPEQALKIRLHYPMRAYLNKKKTDKLIILV